MAKEQKWEVASKLKIARAAAGLTQPALADQLNIPVSTYRTYEGGAVPKDQAIRGILTNWLASQSKKPPFVISSTAKAPEQAVPKTLKDVLKPHPLGMLTMLLTQYKKEGGDLEAMRFIIAKLRETKMTLEHLETLITLVENVG